MNTSAVRDFKVVTYNCKNMDTAHPVFEELSKSVDVVLVQEHWYFDCQLDRLNTACQKYIGCGKAVDTGDPILPVQMPRGYGGVAVLWKDNIDHLINKLPEGGNRIQCVELATDEPLLLISVYMPCKGLRENVDEFQDCIAQLQEILVKYRDTHGIVLGGDFNEDLHSEKDSARLSSFRTLVEEAGLKTQLTKPTYINSDGVDTSTIDHIFYSSGLSKKLSEITRLEEIHSSASDHYPVACTIQWKIAENKKTVTFPLPSKVKWDKVDKEQYEQQVNHHIDRVKTEYSSLGVLDNEINRLTSILKKATDSSAPRPKKKRRKAKLKVWSTEVQNAVKAKKEAFWQWKIGGRPEEKEHHLVISKKLASVNLRKICRFESAKIREGARQEILDARSEDTKMFHKLINRQRGKLKFCVNELHVDGEVYSDVGDGIMRGWFEHFKSLATPSENPDFDEHYRRLVDIEVMEIIDMCCELKQSPTELVTNQQVKDAIKSLNRGKAADVYGLTAEHFLYGGDGLVDTTTDIINGLFKFGRLSDALKVGVLTPVYKKKGSAVEAKNYRGITILPIITKVLEAVLRKKIQLLIDTNQNVLQRGFTKNSSPMNGSLILEEVIREHKDKRLPLYVAFLDAKSAFDVVSHNSLMRKLYHIGVEGVNWSLIHSLHEGAESVVKWEGAVSEKFQVRQGVRQSGLLSTDLYKVYGNGLLDKLTASGDGCHIGNINCVAPTVADDLAVTASSLTALQRIVSSSVDFSLMERYLLQPVKSVIVAILSQCRDQAIKGEDINISMNGVQMPIVKEAMHMGIQRSEDSQESAVKHNIEKARRTVYSLMAAGFHGNNGLDPDTSIHLLQTYVIPVLVCGLEVLLPRRALMEKLDRLHKKFLKMILSLPDTVADPAVYILSGSTPIECIVHKRALTLYGNICRLGEETVEKQLARRVLSVKGYNGSSWFVDIRKLLIKYDLPPAAEMLNDPPTRYRWKRLVRQEVDQYWTDRIKSQAVLYSSLKYLYVHDFWPGKKHPSIQAVTGMRDVPRVCVKAKLITGTYILQVNRVAFNQNEISPTCLLCGEDDETVEHFILQCSALADVRQSLLQQVRDTYHNLFHEQLGPESLLQFILDSGMMFEDVPKKQKQCRIDIEKISRCLCQRLHAERYKRLSLVPKCKKRAKKGGKGDRSTSP